jgi:hypothetical protein
MTNLVASAWVAPTGGCRVVGVPQRDVGGETGRVGDEVSARNQFRGTVTGPVAQAGSPYWACLSRRIRACAKVGRDMCASCSTP